VWEWSQNFRPKEIPYFASSARPNAAGFAPKSQDLSSTHLDHRVCKRPCHVRLPFRRRKNEQKWRNSAMRKCCVSDADVHGTTSYVKSSIIIGVSIAQVRTGVVHVLRENRSRLLRLRVSRFARNDSSFYVSSLCMGGHAERSDGG
jgi:hypothetical protein